MNEGLIKTGHDIIEKMFSDDGFSNGSFSIRCVSGLNLSIEKARDEVKFIFKENCPTATISKFIKLSVKVTGISLGKDGGTIMIDNFPDISFKYEWIK